ncbi:MAG TPA: protein kinase [Polyangiaceae bacterium]|nr:protein kinase [Polyangiaceae bacterium]
MPTRDLQGSLTQVEGKTFEGPPGDSHPRRRGVRGFAHLRLPSRFQVIQELGSGGMGAVYRAYDRTAGHEVALKVLHGFSVEDRLQLKSEFRALSDIVHPNLVVLHDLIIDEESCFFTMEFIRGRDFATAVRELGKKTQDPEQRHARFRDLARQLALALDALHRGGKLHRDIKPSNVLVTEAGRAVLLDFGLTSAATLSTSAASERVGGTLPYMAPEQLFGQQATLASDWYSFGMTLYEAIAGELPSRLGLMTKNGAASHVSLRERGFDVAEDVDALVAQLLSLEAADRPESDEILRRLGATTQREDGVPSHPPPRTSIELIGREPQLEELQRLSEETGISGTRVVRVLGASGVGKSSLLRAFFARLDADPKTLPLRSRCHPQEALAFNAIDGFIDQLSREVATVLPPDARELLPGQHAALTQVFPVLAKALGLDALAPISEVSDREKRHLAFAAIRELLNRIAARVRIVVWLDDLQWGDQDSGMLLRDLLRAAGRPQLFLILSYREEDEGISPCLQVLHEDEELWRSTVALRIRPLNDFQSAELVKTMLGQEWQGDETARDELIRSAAGSPFLLTELGRYLMTPRAPGSNQEGRGTRVGLDEMLRVRTRDLSQDSRVLLEVLAVAGAPLERETTLLAANVASSERGLLTNLERLSILRTTDVQSHRVEFYHDKLREEVLRQLAEVDRVRHHRAIANAIMGSSSPNPLVALDHFDAAGDVQSVRRYVVAAANYALKLLAFERAARLFRRAIDLEPGEVTVRELYRRLGSALASAGRGNEAGMAYATAAELVKDDPEASQEEAIALQQKAAEQFIQSGRFQEGTEMIREVLAELSVPLPKTRGEALRKAAGLRMLSLAQGLKPRVRKEPPSDLELRRFDALWGANTRLSMVDYALVSYATIRCARDALKLGEPSRMCRALGMEATLCSTMPYPIFQKRALALSAVAEELARGPGAQPYDATFALMVRAIIAFYRGEYRTAWRSADEAIAWLHRHSPARNWEEAPWQMWLLSALALNGEISELLKRVRAASEDATLREDRYVETNISLGPPALAWLVMDQPGEGLSRADQALAWSPSAYTVQHYQHYVTTIDCDLYRGDAATAWQRTVLTWPSHKREYFLMVQWVRDDLLRSRARAAIAAALATRAGGQTRTATGHTTEELLTIARRDAERIGSHGLGSTRGGAALIQAALSNIGGDTTGALAHLTTAAAAFDGAEMKLHREIARYSLGQLKGEAGRAEVEQALAWMSEQGVLVPEHLVRAFAPGLLRSGSLEHPVR